MNFRKQINQLWHLYMGDSLYRNSVYLISSTLVVALFGFLYWAIAAHLYTTKDVGLVATLVAISNVVMILSLLGYDNSFIHYLPKSKTASDQIDTGLTVSVIAALFGSLIYLSAIALFIPRLGFVNSSMLWMGFFILFMVVNLLNFLTNFPFVAYRIAHIVLLINTGMGILRLGLLLIFTGLGLYGLLLAHVLALLAALIVTLYYMKTKIGYRFRLRIHFTELKRMGSYTFHSYLSTVFLTLPAYILPTFIVSRLGTSNTAYYYIVAVIIAALNVIPMAISQSLFAEGAWSIVELKEHIIKAIKIMILLTIPAVIILIVFGRYVLAIFGQEYAGTGYALLALLSLAVVPKLFSYLLSTILRVEHKVLPVAAVYFCYAAVVLVGSFFGIIWGYGLIAIGWATLFAEIITTLLFSLVLYGRLKQLFVSSVKITN